ncbi:hypothetical protein [Hymenobacter sp. HDW8]|uniref:hypothetical protein n=1 Tax=Hymenobacter sp. HDW8 TaxID=2714932 RepID=UPI00140B9106|nr:hypothetical protein [Hymenobacter sp. HDW8]QIL75380.1 hypothetical protein G7064_05600 [Hymenobacter sp. HDW8]
MSSRLYFGCNAWLLVMLGLLLTACGPSYYLAVQPTELKGDPVNASQTLFAELDGVEVELTFSHFRIKDAVFQAEIRNGSSQPVMVDPANFYYQLSALQAALSTADTASFLPPVPAYDPEAEVQPLSTRLSIDNGAVMGVSEIEWLVIMASVTKEAIGKKRLEASRTTENRQKSTPQTQGKDVDDMIAQELELWQGAMLRRYNLQPGELIRGYVVFPGYDQAAVLRIITPVGPHVFTFDYSQKRLKY